MEKVPAQDPPVLCVRADPLKRNLIFEVCLTCQRALSIKTKGRAYGAGWQLRTWRVESRIPTWLRRGRAGAGPGPGRAVRIRPRTGPAPVRDRFRTGPALVRDRSGTAPALVWDRSGIDTCQKLRFLPMRRIALRSSGGDCPHKKTIQSRSRSAGGSATSACSSWLRRPSRVAILALAPAG